jgi:hypothetical protein
MDRSQAWTTSLASCSISEPSKPVPGWKNGKKFAKKVFCDNYITRITTFLPANLASAALPSNLPVF